MNIFLKMKHWQIFALFFILPLIADAAFDNLLPAGSDDDWYIKLLINGFIVFLAVAYLWTLGTYFYEYLPEKSGNLRPNLFKAGLVYVFLEFTYLFTFADFFIIEKPASPFYLVPIHVLGMIAYFYALYFVAKALAGVKLEKDANLNDFAGFFFMLWFYPIGIWFLQPQVNDAFENKGK